MPLYCALCRAWSGYLSFSWRRRFIWCIPAECSGRWRCSDHIYVKPEATSAVAAATYKNGVTLNVSACQCLFMYTFTDNTIVIRPSATSYMPDVFFYRPWARQSPRSIFIGSPAPFTCLCLTCADAVMLSSLFLSRTPVSLYGFACSSFTSPLVVIYHLFNVIFWK